MGTYLSKCFKRKPSYSPVASFWEVVFRMTLSSFCGSALAVWAPPRIIPEFETDVVALIALAFAPLFPTYLFGIGKVALMMEHNVVFGLACSSMLLAAFTVSEGLSVAVFAIFVMILSSFQFGPKRGQSVLYAEFGATMAGLMALSYRELVQNGITVVVPIDEIPAADEVSDGGFLVETLSSLCLQLGQPDDCWMEAQFPALDSSLQFTIPGDGDFSGQTATVTPNPEDSSLTISVPGGLWIVAGLWTWRGLDNPLAGMRNFIIAWSWGILCTLVGILFPPTRTVRRVFSEGLIPAAIKDVAVHARSHLDDERQHPVEEAANDDNADVVAEPKNEADAAGEVEGNEKENMSTDTITVQANKNVTVSDEKEKRIQRLVHYGVQFHGGQMAMLTAYEPRLLRAPFECYWRELTDLMSSMHNLILATLAIGSVWEQTEDSEDVRAFYVALGEVDGVMDRCASALASNDDPADGKLDSLKVPSDHTMVFQQQVSDVLKGTVNWLTVLQHPGSTRKPLWTREGLKRIKDTCLPWLALPIGLLTGLAKAFVLPLRPQLWDAKSFFWAVKWTIGWVALYCMSVYWEAYHNFGIETGKGDASGLFDGWNLLAYGFTWTPTVEGTVKKGLQRLSGSALGGFAAWLGIIVASWSYDDEAEINPYGLVAWLSFMSFLNAICSIDRGAFVGRSKDHGFHGIYFGLTLGICSLEVFAGDGSKGDIVVNRIVTTVTGVAMAMLLALLPPYYWGNEPQLARELLAEEKSAVANCLRLLISEKEDITSDLQASLELFRTNSAEKYGNATARFKDASGLQFLPFFKTDPALGKLYDKLSVTGSMIDSWLGVAARNATKDSFVAEFAASGRAHHEVITFIKELDTAEDSEEQYDVVKSSNNASPGNEESSEKDEASDHGEVHYFMVTIRRIMARFSTYDATLSEM